MSTAETFSIKHLSYQTHEDTGFDEFGEVCHTPLQQAVLSIFKVFYASHWPRWVTKLQSSDASVAHIFTVTPKHHFSTSLQT